MEKTRGVCVCMFPRGSPHNGRIFDDTMIGNFFILFPGHMIFSRLPCDLVSILSGLAWLWDLDWFPNATKTWKPLAQGTVMNSCQKQDAWWRRQKAREREWDEEMFPSETEKRQKEDAQMGGLTCWSLGGEGVGAGKGQVINCESQVTVNSTSM